jgi:hypothetical protein
VGRAPGPLLGQQLEESSGQETRRPRDYGDHRGRFRSRYGQ